MIIRKKIIYLSLLFMVWALSMPVKAEEKPDANNNSSQIFGIVWDKNKNKSKKSDFGKQMWKNANISWDVYKSDDYRWRNFGLGTGYGQNFEFDKKAYWLVGLNLNFGKYTLYKGGIYNPNLTNNISLSTTSLSIPAVVGYNIYKNPLMGLGTKVYTGPILEFLTSLKQDSINYNDVTHYTNGDIQKLQLGWTVGANFRFLYLLSARLAYSYYLTNLFSNENSLNRSAVTFTVGL